VKQWQSLGFPPKLRAAKKKFKKISCLNCCSLSAKSSDRRLIVVIVSPLSIIYLTIFILAATRIPNYDPFSPVLLLGESIFAALFSTIGLLLYIFGSKKMTWKMTKSRNIGRYGRLFYLIITATILLTYSLIIYVFVNGYFTTVEENEKQNLITGLILVAVLLGSLILVYLKHVYREEKGMPSRYKRHPPVFHSFKDDIPK
jgi:magnesium-transporting ATPase (P-type)